MTIGEVLGFLLIGCIVGPSHGSSCRRRPDADLDDDRVRCRGAFLGGWLLAEVITPDNKGVPWIAAIVAGAALVVLVRLVRRGTTGSTHRQLS